MEKSIYQIGKYKQISKMNNEDRYFIYVARYLIFFINCNYTKDKMSSSLGSLLIDKEDVVFSILKYFEYTYI